MSLSMGLRGEAAGLSGGIADRPDWLDSHEPQNVLGVRADADLFEQ